MLNVLTGDPTSLVFDIVEDGQFVSPTVGTVVYTLRDNAGQAVAGHTQAAVTTIEGQTTVLIPITGALNAKTKTFEFRTVTLQVTVDGRDLSFRQTYRVHDWLPFVTTPEDVRAFIGFAEDELSDRDTDLVAAYLALKEGLPSLDDYLASGDLSAIRANRAVVCQAVVDLAQSIPGRAIQSKRSETAQMSRFQSTDWSQVKAQASAELSELKQKLTTSLAGAFPLLTLATPVDPITGS
jgi:hypothetical protein